nr:hypothetical protein [Massilia genomosp. 1]
MTNHQKLRRLGCNHPLGDTAGELDREAECQFPAQMNRFALRLPVRSIASTSRDEALQQHAELLRMHAPHLPRSVSRLRCVIGAMPMLLQILAWRLNADKYIPVQPKPDILSPAPSPFSRQRSCANPWG